LSVLDATDRFNWPKPGLRPPTQTRAFSRALVLSRGTSTRGFVALIKLGSLVNVTIVAGFCCYCGVALCLVITQRSFDFEVTVLPVPR